MDTLVKVDGRRARGLRTRDAIVGALSDLLAEDDLTPTAQRVADRAGVSVRSVYQHFTDVEGLFQETARRTWETAASMRTDIDPSWPLERRIEVLAAERGAVLETLTPFNRAVRLIESTSPALRQSRQAFEEELRQELQAVFAPELSRLGPAEQATVLTVLDMVTSWPSWDHLRESGCTEADTRRAVRVVLLTVLGSLRRGPVAAPN